MSGLPFKGYPDLAVQTEEHLVLAQKFSQHKFHSNRDEQGVSEKAEKNPILSSLEDILKVAKFIFILIWSTLFQ